MINIWKIIRSSGVFFIFPKMKSQEPYIMSLSFMVQMCKMMFFQCWNFNFPGFQEVQMAKNARKWWKFLHLLYLSNHILYDLHSCYKFMCKRIISLGTCFIFFKILIFGIIRESGKSAKNGPKWQKNCLISLCITGTVHQVIVIFGTHVKWRYLANFFIFQKFDFWDFKGGKRAKK